MDEAKKGELFSVISEGNINNCLNKRSRFEKTLFGEGLDRQKLKELKEDIFQSVEVDLNRLKYQSPSASAKTN